MLCLCQNKNINLCLKTTSNTLLPYGVKSFKQNKACQTEFSCFVNKANQKLA